MNATQVEFQNTLAPYTIQCRSGPLKKIKGQPPLRNSLHNVLRISTEITGPTSSEETRQDLPSNRDCISLPNRALLDQVYSPYSPASPPYSSQSAASG